MGAEYDDEYLKNGEKCFNQALNYERSLFLKFDAYLVDRMKKVVEAKNWFLKISQNVWIRKYKIDLCDVYLKEYKDKIIPVLEDGIKNVKRCYNTGFYSDGKDWIKAIKGLVAELNDYFNTDVYNWACSQCQWYEEQIDEILNSDDEEEVDEMAQYRAYQEAKYRFDNYQSSLRYNHSSRDYTECLRGLDEIYDLLAQAGDYSGVDDLYQDLKDA